MAILQLGSSVFSCFPTVTVSFDTTAKGALAYSFPTRRQPQPFGRKDKLASATHWGLGGVYQSISGAMQRH